MYARLQHLLVTAALVSTALTGVVCTAAAPAGRGSISAMHSPSSSGRGVVHAARKCKPDQIDACKPDGCCIVD